MVVLNLNTKLQERNRLQGFPIRLSGELGNLAGDRSHSKKFSFSLRILFLLCHGFLKISIAVRPSNHGLRSDNDRFIECLLVETLIRGEINSLQSGLCLVDYMPETMFEVPIIGRCIVSITTLDVVKVINHSNLILGNQNFFRKMCVYVSLMVFPVPVLCNFLQFLYDCRIHLEFVSGTFGEEIGIPTDDLFLDESSGEIRRKRGIVWTAGMPTNQKAIGKNIERDILQCMGERLGPSNSRRESLGLLV
ncbi:hypothetical protein SDC9_149510 [bioreactor metagenome]|uniref:Uncharacterized protein n=1 Tax=bioreactor metagenome TaxID=1076179 RepID=A0A645ELF6_9ZZZZ